MKTARAPFPRLTLLLLLLVATAFAANALAQDLQVSASGNTIYWSTPGGYGCGGANIGPVFLGGASCSATSNCSVLPGNSGSIGCNRPGTYEVTGCWYDSVYCKDPKPPVCQTAIVTVSEPPPPSCPEFELYTKTTQALAHKYGPEPWPTGQNRDSQVEIVFKPIRVLSGTTINLRVFDPPDTATYRTNQHPGDNFDTAAGTVSLSPSDTGAKTATLTSGDDPVTIYLNTSSFVAGDNYTVRASADPELISNDNFVCGTTCRETQPVTVWKRVYLERKRMFRSGVLVAGTASAGQNQVLIEIPRDRAWKNVRLNPGDAIRLVHAPRYDGFDFSNGFYSEDAVVTAVAGVTGNRRRRLLTLADNLQHTYTNDSSYPEAMADGVSDGVGNLRFGFYERNEGYATPEFGKAFVELFPIPQGNDEIPFLWYVRRPIWVANKWFENTPVSPSTARRGNSNVRHVLAGTGMIEGHAINTGLLGQVDIPVAGSPPEVNDCWTWVRAIEAGNHITSKFDKWTVNGENVVHELAHTFRVNYTVHDPADTIPGHCDRNMASNAALFCTMSHGSYENGQNGDGVVGFHYSSDDDSEYMTIRRNTEPVPLP
jgi:hypothetical protein